MPTAVPSTSEQRSNWPLIALVWLAGLGAAAQFGKMAVMLEPLRSAYGASDVMLGLIVSCTGFAGLLLGVVSGVLVDRIGFRKAMLGGLAAGAALSALQALLPPLPVLIALRLIEGVAHLAIVVSGPVLMSYFASDAQRPAVMTLWSSFFPVAFLGLAVLTASLPDMRLPPFLLSHALWLALVALALWRALPGPVRTGVAAGERLGLMGWLKAHVDIYRSPFLSAPGLGFVWYTAQYVALLTFLPEQVAEGDRGSLAALMPLVSVVTSLTLGITLLRVMDPVRVVQIGFAATIVAGLWLWITPAPDEAFWPALAIMAALGLVPGASFAAIAALNPSLSARSRSTGAIAQLGNVGTTSGPPLLAAIAIAFGTPGTAAFVVILSIIGIALHAGLALRRRGAVER